MPFSGPRLRRILPPLAAALLLGGCGYYGLGYANREAVKSLAASIQKEFDLLVKEFDELDAQGDLALCAPVPFSVARFAVYQAVEERREADLERITRFITRARGTLAYARNQMDEKKCVDSDGDGLTDLEETRIHKTNPNNADTDADGLADGLEVRRYRTDPLRADTDGDLLNDGEEVRWYKTSPLHADSDGDGYPEGIEVASHTDPLDPCSMPKKGARRPGPWTKCLKKAPAPAENGAPRDGVADGEGPAPQKAAAESPPPKPRGRTPLRP